MAVTNNPLPPGTTPSTSGTVTAADLQALQTKYTTDQVQVAAGKMDASQLTSDWNSYLSAAQAWQTGSASGNAGTTILPINEPVTSISTDLSTSYSGSTPVVPSTSTSTPVVSTSTASTGGGTPSISTGTVSAGSTGGVPSYLAGSAPLDPSFRNGPYKYYADAIEAAAKATGVSANILGAMVADESQGNYTNMTDPLQCGGTGSMADNMLQGAKHLIDSANESAAKFGTGSLGIALRDYNSGLLNTNPNDLHSIQNAGQPQATGVSYYVDKVTSNLNLISSGQSGSLPL